MNLFDTIGNTLTLSQIEESDILIIQEKENSRNVGYVYSKGGGLVLSLYGAID